MSYRPITSRTDFIADLRAIADFLEANPTLPLPGSSANWMNIPLTTNADVEKLAAERGWEVTADSDGNLSTGVDIGHIRYHAYGYVDFEQHRDGLAERTARQWADKHGIELVPPVGDES